MTRRPASRQKPRDIEGPIHRSIKAYLHQVFPTAVIHHSPNAIGLSGDLIARLIAKNTRNGTVTGFPDLLVLPWAHIGPLLFEVKTDDTAPSEEQAKLHDQLGALGYRVAVVRSIKDVQDALTGWGIWSKPGARRVVTI